MHISLILKTQKTVVHANKEGRWTSWRDFHTAPCPQRVTATSCTSLCALQPAAQLYPQSPPYKPNLEAPCTTLAHKRTPSSWKQQLLCKQACLEAGEHYSPLPVSPYFNVFAFADACPIFPQLCWLHVLHQCCKRNSSHLCRASRTACFYFSFFEVPLIIYDLLWDSKAFPSIEASRCKLEAAPSNRLLLLMSSVEPTSWLKQQIFIFGERAQRK